VVRKTEPSKEAALLELRSQYPEWGARKLSGVLGRDYGIELASRTADHILKRHGLTAAPPKRSEPVRFARQECGALLQMDFKGLPRSAPYALLSVLDDHGRFCLAFEPVPDKTGASVKAVLWTLFERHGLPASILTDNGDCWGSVNSKFPTAFGAWLMRLGIKPIHGRPGHPQTQGKVERFHGTAMRELGAALLQPSIELARPIYQQFVDRYNWIRPHDALGGATPGSCYAPFARARPEQVPQHQIPEGAISRKVDMSSRISYKGRTYNVGDGLIGQRLVISQAQLGERLFYCGFPLPYLDEL
jgi:transposase InsO family protein